MCNAAAPVLESIAVAAAKISGEADVIIAGGFESLTTQPRRGYNSNHQLCRRRLVQRSQSLCREFTTVYWRERSLLPKREGTKEMDSWVLRSHALAQAREQGLLQDIIAPVCGAVGDEGIRPRMSQRLLDRMPKDGGGAANLLRPSCLINDGAAFVVLCSQKYLQEHGKGAGGLGNTAWQRPFSEIRVLQFTALQKLWQSMACRSIADFELNEAFAVIDVLFARSFPARSTDKYNVFGGAWPTVIPMVPAAASLRCICWARTRADATAPPLLRRRRRYGAAAGRVE